ncbi:MAG: hypothetical protein SOV61_06165 [Lachnospiraceae bacterium]|nr:hypothetical protein [Lachnospiraceae bacterium]
MDSIMGSKDGVFIVKEKVAEEVLFNRQVNYLIIEKMWEYLNKGKDKQELYNLIGINKNMYYRIRTADTYNCVNLDRRWDYENSSLRKTGLSKEIMTGLEMIEIEGITKENWEEYINFRYKDKEQSSYRTSAMQLMNRKLKDTFAGLKADKKDKRDIGKLFYFFKYGRAVTLDISDTEMIDLKESLSYVSVENMKVCDKSLRKEVYELLKEKYRQLDIIIKYESL